MVGVNICYVIYNWPQVIFNKQETLSRIQVYMTLQITEFLTHFPSARCIMGLMDSQLFSLTP